MSDFYDKSLLLIDDKYLLSSDGEFIIPKEEVDIANLLTNQENNKELKSLIWKDFDLLYDSNIIEKAENFKEYFNDFLNIRIKKIFLEEEYLSIKDRYYIKTVIIACIKNKNTNEIEYKQLINNSNTNNIKFKDISIIDSGFVKLNPDDIDISDESLFYTRISDKDKINSSIVNSINILEKFIRNNNEYNINDLDEIIICHELPLTSKYIIKLKNSIGDITVNKESRQRNLFANYITLNLKPNFNTECINFNDRKIINMSNIDINKTSEIINKLNEINAIFERMVDLSFSSKLAPRVKTSIIPYLDKNFNYKSLNEKFDKSILDLIDSDNIFTERTIKKIILKIYRSFISDKNNFKILNKLIRLYYNNDNIDNNHIGKIYITWFVFKVLKPKALKGIDLKKKYGLTSANISKILVDSF